MAIERPKNVAHPDIWEEVASRILQGNKDSRNTEEDLKHSIVWGYAFLCGCRGLKPYRESRNQKKNSV